MAWAHLDVPSQNQTAHSEVRRGAVGQVHQQHPIDALAVLIEHHQVRKALHVQGCSAMSARYQVVHFEAI